VQQAVGVVQTHCDDAMCDCLGGVKRQKWSDVTQGMRVVVASTHNLRHMTIQRETRVQRDAEQFDCVAELNHCASDVNSIRSVCLGTSGTSTEQDGFSLGRIQQHSVFQKPALDIRHAIRRSLERSAGAWPYSRIQLCIVHVLVIPRRRCC